MNILSALVGLAGATRSDPLHTATADPRAGLFAALLGRQAEVPMAEPDAGAPREDGRGAAVLAEIQTALADPDMGDEALAETIAPLVAALTGQMLPVADADTGAPLPAEQRLLAALQALQEVAGDARPQPEAAPDRTPMAVSETAPRDALETAPSVVPEKAPAEALSTAPSGVPTTVHSGAPKPAPSGVPEKAPAVVLGATPRAVPETVPSAVPETASRGASEKAPGAESEKAPAVTLSAAPSTVLETAPGVVPEKAPAVAMSAAPSAGLEAVPRNVPEKTPAAALNPAAEAPNEGAAEVRTELSRLVSVLTAREGEARRPMAGSSMPRGDLEAGPVRAGAEAVTRLGPPTEAPAGASAETGPDLRPETPAVRAAPPAGEARAPIPYATEPPAAPQTQPLAPVAATAAASPTPAPRAAPLPDSGQILTQLRAHVSETGTIRVALRPEGLGRVEISLTPGDDGQLSVTVRADQTSVLGSLRADREGLLTLLREAGHQIDTRSLSFGDLGDQRGGDGAQQGAGQGGRPGTQSMTWTGPGEPAADATETPTRVAAPSGAVDITV
ncbi:flagellar hook-length control protein FliK [Marinovum sp.]|uniref:flagellar hook-length control protein FliK n=1 Tax=Marinovum sp. TaxID=2024839 RepID=UPI002B277CAF|nr:flagellar hook-length control protein FliK [Marinovum sp.]